MEWTGWETAGEGRVEAGNGGMGTDIVNDDGLVGERVRHEGKRRRDRGQTRGEKGERDREEVTAEYREGRGEETDEPTLPPLHPLSSLSLKSKPSQSLTPQFPSPGRVQ